MPRVSWKALAIGSAGLVWALGAIAQKISQDARPRPSTDARIIPCITVGPLERKPREKALLQYRADVEVSFSDRKKLSYCVASSIKITGRETWTTSFPVTLTSRSGPIGRPVVVPDNIPAGSTRELPPVPPWCVETDKPPALVISTPYGSCSVKFGP